MKFWGHVPPINHLPFEFGIQTAWKEAVRNMHAFRRGRKPSHVADGGC